MTDLTTAAKVVLAGMISLMPPGKSVFSRTNLNICDDKCQITKTCESDSNLCAPPVFDPMLFDQKIKDISNEISQESSIQESIRLQSFTRAENYEEGLGRYATIAQAITNVSEELSWQRSSEECRLRCSKGETIDFCKSCWGQHPWPGSSKELAAALTAVFYGESGFRQDIHSGVGKLARGDCAWRDSITHKRVAAFTKGAEIISGTCRSVCLGQINIGPDEKFGYRAEDLVGVDLASTQRCAEVSAKMLSIARKRCSGPFSDYTGNPIQGMFSMYGSGKTCRSMIGTAATLREADWPAKRFGWFRDLLKPRQLDRDVEKLLLSPTIAGK